MKLNKIFILGLFILGCKNPLAGDSTGSKIGDNYFPGLAENDPGTTVASITGVSSIIANGTTPSTVTITLLTTTNTPIVGVTPTFSASGSNNTYSACSVTNGSGVSTCALRSTTAEVKTLSVTSPISSTGGTVTFVAGPATQIVFTTQPVGGVGANVTLPTQPILEIRDVNNNLIISGADSTANITLSLSSGTGALGGTVTKAAVAGVATFTNVDLNTSGTGKVITATKADLSGSGGTASLTATSNSFTINAAAPGAFTITSTSSTSNSITVNWSASVGAASYTLKYGTTSGSYGNVVSTAATTGASIPSLNRDTNYYIMVTAVNGTGSTDATAEAVVKIVSSSPSLSTLEFTPRSVAADGSSISTITVTLKDTANAAAVGRTVSVTSSRGATDTVTALSAISDSSGVATFSVKSSTSGYPVISAAVSTESVTLTQTTTLQFLPLAPLIDLGAWYATLTSEGVNGTSSTSTWKNASVGGSTYNGILTNFALDGSLSTSRWGGDGTTSITNANTGPYRLIFDGVNNYVDLGTSFNTNTDVSFSGWIRPTASTARGTVIMSNGDSSSKGWTLRQRWDGSGGLTLHTGSSSYAEEVLKLQPSVYYRFSEASGSTSLYNSAANDNTAGFTGVTLGATGALANDSDTALTFTKASSTLISVPDNTAFDNTNKISISMWVKPGTGCQGGSVFCGLVSKRVNTNSSEAYIIFLNDRTAVFRVAGNQAAQINSGSAATVGTWYHYVFVFDGSLDDNSPNFRKKIYVNGSLVASGTEPAQTLINSTAAFEIGHFGGNATSYFDGSMDEVAVFNGKALTPTEVSTIYAARNNHAVHSTVSLANSAWNFVGGIFASTTNMLTLALGSNTSSIAKTGASINGSGTTLTLGAAVSSGAITTGTPWQGAIGQIHFFNSAATTGNLTTIQTTTAPKYP